MDNLAFHITDIAANSIRAKSSRIEIETSETEHKRSIKIIDNGTGMSKEVVDQVTNPFYTTRTTRKMGFGLPFLKQNAEQAGGRVEIQSEPGKGTTVYAEFDTQNIDCPPWGNLPETIALLITGNPKVNSDLKGLPSFWKSEEFIMLHMLQCDRQGSGIYKLFMIQCFKCLYICLLMLK